MVESLSDLLTFLMLLIIGLFVWGAFSPFEALGWWAGWFGEEIYVEQQRPSEHIRVARPNADSYILFLSGIGRVSGETFSLREQGFLQRLAAALPHSVIIDDIFPYSVNNLPLTGQPFFARLWRWALRRKLDGPHIAGNLINIRNIWQVCISADNRYGPIYNQAVAEVLLHSLLRYDYDVERQRPIFIIGYSGAGQIAVGAVTYLRQHIRAPIYVISLGGIFSSEPGLLRAEHFYHIYGSTDWACKLGWIAPGRWPIFPSSDWNRARRQGLITLRNVGPMCHSGAGGYLDRNSHLPDGTSHMDHIVQLVTDVVHRHTDTVESIGTVVEQTATPSASVAMRPSVPAPTGSPLSDAAV